MSDYAAFLQAKSQIGSRDGFAPVWMPDFLFDFQASMVDWALRQGRAALFEDCGLGKGQPEGAMILTPTGFVPNTDLTPGQMVIGSDGQPYAVKAKYVRGMQPVYRVHFSDGVSFVVDSDHLHILRTNNDRQRKKPWRVVSTKDLLKMPIRYGDGGKSRNLDIPVVAPIFGERREHWIHPYVLGVILGDGCITARCGITLADAQIVETVRALLPAGWTLTKKQATKYDYSISKGGGTHKEFIQELRRLGLLGTRSATKFIPDEYLFDSVDNRVWLLRGLMDTDGWIKDTSQFYSTSKQLADDTMHLIRSLGGVPTRAKKKTSCMHDGTRRIGADCHVLTFSLKTFNPFHLARKAALWNPAPRDNGRWIDRIEECGTARTICLSVDSPDQSYVTEHHIVTHNTPQELVWAENVVRKTNGRVLLVTALAVTVQMLREAEKFGIKLTISKDGKAHPGITVTNYERLHLFNSSDFVGMVGDESSIIKNFAGTRRGEVTAFMRKMRYRLLATATAAPNDFIELGTSSEALGYLGHVDMLNRFFKNDLNNSAQGRMRGEVIKWRLKGHAEVPFWRWVCSWARAIRKPSDLGFDDERFILPELIENEHLVEANSLADGMLFAMPAVGLKEQRDERRRTIEERCAKVAELVNRTGEPALVWCHLNEEGDTLENMIPDSVQVSGADSDDAKEERLLAFADGKARVLVTKPKIGAWGLNFQHCNHVTTFPSHSFEQYYQGVRRCWRFGQKRPVTVDVITTEGEQGVVKNLQRKATQADQMFTALVREMNSAMAVDRAAAFTRTQEIPEWL